MPVPCRPLSPVGTALPGRRVGFWRAGGRARPGLPAALSDAGAQRHREREPRAALRRAGPAGDPRGGGRGLHAASLGAAVTGSAWVWAAAARRGVPPVGVGGRVWRGSGSRVGTLNPRCSLPWLEPDFRRIPNNEKQGLNSRLGSWQAVGIVVVSACQ